MKKYAQIVDNRVHYILECEELPSFHSSIMFVDVTDVQPMPKEGDLYAGGEFLPNDGKAEARRELKRSDESGETLRVLEDLIDLLVGKNSFTLNELPQEAQDKLAKRKALRDIIQ